MITIYGSPQSSAGRCFWCLEEAEVDYTYQPISFKDKGHKSEEFLRINPHGKVPALNDDGYLIWESVAINHYVAQAYKPSLLGEDPKAQGLVCQWSTWSVTELQPPLIQAFIQLVFVPEERRDQSIIDKSFEKLPGLLTPLESHLEDADYLVGNSFTLADLNVSFVVSICHAVRFDLSSYPNILKWQALLAEREGYKRYQAACK